MDWQSILPGFISATIPATAAIIAAIIASRSAKKARDAEERAQLAEHQAARLLALEERTAERKREVYQPFIEALGNMMIPKRTAAALSQAEEVIADFANSIMVWGSDDVVRAFYRYRRASGSNPPPIITMRLMSDLIVAMRRDVAWPDTEVNALHTIGARINDLEPGGELERGFTMDFNELAKRESWTPPW